MTVIRQTFINVLDGDGDDIITAGTERISKKSNITFDVFKYPRTPDPTLEAAISDNFTSSMSPWRLYIRGHGDWQNKRVGGVNGPDLARRLAAWHLGQNLPEVISVTGCGTARGTDQTAKQVYKTISEKSFAFEFFKALGDNGIKTKMYARTMNMTTAQGVVQAGKLGQKFTMNPVTGMLAHKQEFSKIRYYWDGSAIKYEFVDYIDSAQVDDAMDVEDLNGMDVDA